MMNGVPEPATETEPDVFDAGLWIRAARRTRKVSQRELAALAHVSETTIARAESGRHAPRIESFARLLAALGYELVITTQFGHLLTVDAEHERLRDVRGRRFPAHLESGPTPKYSHPDWQSWWGWHRIAWQDSERPPFTFWRRGLVTRALVGEPRWGPTEQQLWDDAT
jgi:transcriptional regulator with XRE-family HTH domain